MSSGTPTPNLGLNIRTGTDDYDFNEINTDNTVLDTAVATTICTSGTRPISALFSGRRIYETDTGKFYVYLSGSWIQEPAVGLSGTFANLPASGNFIGQRYWDTTNSQWLTWNGTLWVPESGVKTLYTPTWRNGIGGSGLSVGSGTLEGWYMRDGDFCHYGVRLVRAADTNFGTTGWSFTIPIMPWSYQQAFGAGYFFRGGFVYPVIVNGGGGFEVVLTAPGGGTTSGTRISNSYPASQAAGDWLSFEGTYRVA